MKEKLERLTHESAAELVLLIMERGWKDDTGWHYREEWNDRKLAEHCNKHSLLNKDINAKDVSRLRRKSPRLGNMADGSDKRGAAFTNASLRGEVNDLLARVEALEALVTDPKKKPLTSNNSASRPSEPTASPYDRVHVNTKSWGRENG